MKQHVTRWRAPYGKNREPVNIATKEFHFEARMATQMLERWGPVTCKPDGYDEAGRQKSTNMSVEETVERACEIAALATSAFEKRGWIDDTPKEFIDDEGEDD